MATLRAILAGSCRLREAVDGEDGLRKALAEPPDLVLLDVSLPRMDGMTLLARLRAAASTRGVPVVALTAHAMAGDRERFLRAGCNDYVTKPIEVEALLEAVRKWTRR
jgi:CheY-like chemotaxis protein